MDDPNSYWQAIVDALKGRGLRFRVKWKGDDEMTDWQPWLVCPVPGYLETGCGPVPVRDVEWLDISTSDCGGNAQRPDVVAALATIGVKYCEMPDSIQVAPHVI